MNGSQNKSRERVDKDFCPHSALLISPLAMICQVRGVTASSLDLRSVSWLCIFSLIETLRIVKLVRVDIIEWSVRWSTPSCIFRPNKTQTNGHWRRAAKIDSLRRKQFLLLQQQHSQSCAESDQSRGPRKEDELSRHVGDHQRIGFDWHDMESYFRPDGIGKYSFVGDNEIVFNKPGKQFDAVIMSDCSRMPRSSQTAECFPRLCEEAN